MEEFTSLLEHDELLRKFFQVFLICHNRTQIKLGHDPFCWIYYLGESQKHSEIEKLSISCRYKRSHRNVDLLEL